MKPEEKLLRLIARLEPVEFCGLARTLNVSLVYDNPVPDPDDPKTKYLPRDFADVLKDIMEAYNVLNRDTKRELLRIIKAGVK